MLGLPAASLVTALLVTQFVAFPAALFFGWLGKQIGPRRAILIGLGVYILALVYAWRWLDTGADFYKLAIAVGLVQGGVQSLSRSLYARLVPTSKTAEFFGFFNMVGKFAAILGPLLMSLVPLLIAGADERDSIMALTLLFVAGGYLLWKVDVDAGIEAAKAMEDSGVQLVYHRPEFCCGCLRAGGVADERPSGGRASRTVHPAAPRDRSEHARSWP